jgi:hypothetical protein
MSNFRRKDVQRQFFIKFQMNPATLVTEDSFSKQFVHCWKIRAIFIEYYLFFCWNVEKYFTSV